MINDFWFFKKDVEDLPRDPVLVNQCRHLYKSCWRPGIWFYLFIFLIFNVFTIVFVLIDFANRSQVAYHNRKVYEAAYYGKTFDPPLAQLSESRLALWLLASAIVAGLWGFIHYANVIINYLFTLLG